jgi:hypothetical protein
MAMARMAVVSPFQNLQLSGFLDGGDSGALGQASVPVLHLALGPISHPATNLSQTQQGPVRVITGQRQVCSLILIPVAAYTSRSSMRSTLCSSCDSPDRRE